MKDHALKGWQQLIALVFTRQKAPASIAPILLPLTPEYDPELHGVYSDAIESALRRSKLEVRNIALTGSYGVGKSSILKEVARRHKRRVIAVSLSSSASRRRSQHLLATSPKRRRPRRIESRRRSSSSCSTAKTQ